MFTGVCLSTGRVWSRRGACSGGVWSGGCLLGGGVPAPGGMLVPGGVWSGGMVPGGDPPDGYCCGQYTSYWNAFLFRQTFVLNCII